MVPMLNIIVKLKLNFLDLIIQCIYLEDCP